MIGPVSAATDPADVVHDILGGHRLACPGLSADDDTLALAVDGHVTVHVVRQGVDVRRVLVGCGPLVHVHLLVREVGHLLEGVDRDEDWTNVGEDPVLHEPLLQVVAYCTLRDLKDTALYLHEELQSKITYLLQQHQIIHPRPLVVVALPVVVGHLELGSTISHCESSPDSIKTEELSLN